MSQVLIKSSLVRSGFILKSVLKGNFTRPSVWEAGVIPNMQSGLRYFSDHSGVDAEGPRRRHRSWKYQILDPRVIKEYEEMIHSGAMIRPGQVPEQGGAQGKCEFTMDREIKFCIPLKMKGEVDTANNGECKPSKP